ncbi:NADP-dependent malic enzyme [Candidatus Uhrbacteria bacterium]|nr:NADP-dependent malic enzyme [Candidatus Uhrbacteria bacterium]
MTDIYEQSLGLHRERRGKLEVRSKVDLKTRLDLSLAYTPGVAAVSTAIGKDRDLAYEYTLKGNSVAVVSDGSAILGLGNLGPEAAIPVMEGKAILFREFAGIDAFPICLDTQETEEIIHTVKLLAPVFGGINLEDISAPRCFEIEERLVRELDIPVMHDDQRGTATVVLAGLTNALKVKGRTPDGVRVVVNGAGAAGTAIVRMLSECGFGDIVVCDRQGIISRERVDLNPYKRMLSDATNPRGLSGDLARALVGADIFIGVSAGGVLKPDMVRAMAPEPVIFAMANPTPEIMPEEAKAAGALIVATGRSDFPNQVNNVLAFPGIFRGALDNGVRRIGNAMLVRAAQNLAFCVPEPGPERILPDPLDREVAGWVASAIR